MKITLLTGLLLALAFNLNGKENSTNSEIELISEPLQTYLTGHIKGDKALLGKALHNEGKLSYLRDGEYRKLEFADYLSRMKLRDPNDGIQRTPFIKSIEVSGNVAIGKLVLDYSSILFTDYMTLLKINGEWKITNKIAYSLRDPKNNQAQSVDINAAIAPLKAYMQAYATGKVEPMLTAIHKEAKVMTITKGQFETQTIKHFVDHFNHLSANKKAMLSQKIASIDGTGTVAMGKIVVNYPSSTVTHYLSLLNLNGAWKIVNIAFDVN